MADDPTDIPKALWLAMKDPGTQAALITDLTAFYNNHIAVARQIGGNPPLRAFVSFDGGTTYYAYTDPNGAATPGGEALLKFSSMKDAVAAFKPAAKTAVADDASECPDSDSDSASA